MPKIDNDKFYTSAIEKHGITARGVNWASKKNQQLRFLEIYKLLPDNLSFHSLVDAGCGFGDFYTFLEKKHSLPSNYIGLDSVTDMCSIASSNTAQEILNLEITKEKLPSSDFYVCSGALNTLTTFETHLFIQNCFNASKKAFIFNVLHGEKKSETYNYVSTQQIYDFAEKLQVRDVVLSDAYLDNDLTIRFSR